MFADDVYGPLPGAANYGNAIAPDATGYELAAEVSAPPTPRTTTVVGTRPPLTLAGAMANPTTYVVLSIGLAIALAHYAATGDVLPK